MPRAMSAPSGASILGDQTPVRFRKGALPWAQEEHTAAVYFVRVVQFVDGARQVDADAGMSAPENRGHP